MWGNKKPETPHSAQPEPTNFSTNQPPKPAPATWEDKPVMSTDAMRPLGATADRATARLGASLHVKGEISGNEDLLIDGSVEGLIQLDERKLTVGTTAKVTADIIARDVAFYQPQITPEAVAGLNAFARAAGLLKEPVAYDDLVATQFQTLWTV